MSHLGFDLSSSLAAKSNLFAHPPPTVGLLSVLSVGDVQLLT